MTDTEQLIQKYAAAAAVAASKKPPIDDDILAKYAKAAIDASQEKESEKRAKKEFQRYRPPERRFTYDEVTKLYGEAGIKPARRVYFFKENCPCIQAAYLNEPERKCGSPFGALVLVEAAKAKNPPAWITAPSNDWVLGPIAQLTGFSISYIQGFGAGFDGHAPGHRLCSYDFHCGYADGRIIAALLVKQGLLEQTGSEDPFMEVDDENDLNELVRVQGYWREEWGPKPKYLLDTTDLTEERLKELGLSISELTC